MSKKQHDQKILLMTDTASDIPDEELHEGGIVMLPIPIAIDGTSYLERVDFTVEEFYAKLANAKELPVTSRILAPVYYQAYKDAYNRGYTHVINTTITSKGSGMFESAVLAKRGFFEEHPDARDKFSITVLDSGTYTSAYGYPIYAASKMIAKGGTADEIIDYLDDYYSRVEIYFAAYSLEYVKKSGRVPAAAAFVGDVLGLRPIISIIDGETKVVEKVRGDKNVVARILDIAQARAVDPKGPYVLKVGENPQYAEDLEAIAAKAFKKKAAAKWRAGAAILINAGPKIVGISVLGEKRLGSRAREQDFAPVQ